MDYRAYLADCTYGDEAIADWRWLIGEQMRLWRVTKGGAALLRDSSGAVHLLVAADGSFKRIAASEAEFEAAAGDPANAEAWLMKMVVDGQAALGMVPGPNQCLSFKVPLFLGGEVHPDNVETCDIAVHLSIHGQLVRQLKGLPPGTPIDAIEIAGMPRPASKRPWWKFW